MKRVLITGGAGFIGSNLALQLLKKNYQVTVFDNLSEQIHGKDGNSPLFNSIKDKVRFIKGDVRNIHDWERCLDNQDIIFHFAAETGTGQSMYQNRKYFEVNVIGTSILLDYLTNNQNKIEKVVIASSRAIYGEGKYSCKNHGVFYPKQRNENNLLIGYFDINCPVCNEKAEVVATSEDSLINPISTYAITKYTQELMIMNTCNILGINAIALRFQNVYGPGQSLSNPYTGILAIFSTRFLTNKDVFIFEDGNESRDFIYIDDIVKANVLAIENNEANGKIYNVGSGVPTTVLEVATRMKNIYNSKSNIRITSEARKGDIRHNYADISKIQKDLNFKPEYTFNMGLELFTNWVKEQNIERDCYEESLVELKNKGLLK